MACPHKNTLNILKFAIIMQLYSALYVVRLCSREDQISNSRHSTDRHIMAYSHSNGSFFVKWIHVSTLFVSVANSNSIWKGNDSTTIIKLNFKNQRLFWLYVYNLILKITNIRVGNTDTWIQLSRVDSYLVLVGGAKLSD